MGVGIGLDSYIGLGKETVYGTSVTRTKYLEHNGESLKKSVARIQAASIYNFKTHSSRMKRGRVAVSGDFSVDARYEGLEMLFEQLLGTVATTTPDATNAPTAREHTFTPASTLLTGLTVEVYRGTVDTSQAFLYLGCKVSSCGFAVSNDGILVVSPSIEGQDESSAVKSTPTFSTKDLVIFSEGRLYFGSRELNVRDFNLTYNNNLALDRYFLGSRLRREPTRAGRIEITGSLTIDFEDRNEYNDFVAATTRRLLLNFVGPTIAGGQTYQLQLDCPVTDLEDASPNAGDPGPVPSAVSFRAYHDDTNANDIVIKLKNTVASW